jgi:hypothetical protein
MPDDPESSDEAEIGEEMASAAANFVAMHADHVREHLQQRDHWMRVMRAEGASWSRIAAASGLSIEECRVIANSED